MAERVKMGKQLGSDLGVEEPALKTKHNRRTESLLWEGRLQPLPNTSVSSKLHHKQPTDG